jgi:hypothetical protein
LLTNRPSLSCTLNEIFRWLDEGQFSVVAFTERAVPVPDRREASERNQAIKVAKNLWVMAAGSKDKLPVEAVIR